MARQRVRDALRWAKVQITGNRMELAHSIGTAEQGSTFTIILLAA
jgi:hypothetical protein